MRARHRCYFGAAIVAAVMNSEAEQGRRYTSVSQQYAQGAAKGVECVAEGTRVWGESRR